MDSQTPAVVSHGQDHAAGRIGEGHQVGVRVIVHRDQDASGQEQRVTPGSVEARPVLTERLACLGSLDTSGSRQSLKLCLLLFDLGDCGRKTIRG